MGPYLALPVLKSYLQEVEQYKVDIVDLNVEFYDDLLSFRHVEECCKRYRESKDSFSSNVQLTIELIQKSALNVDEAKDIFRSKRYFNLKERQYAENIFRNALYIINHVSYGVKYTFNSIDLPYDYYSTPEIMKSLADTLHNPFISFYETAFLKRIQREKIEFIGISVSGCFQLISAVTLAKLIKEECPSVKHVSLGGNYITRLADDCMKEWHPFFEYIDSIMMYDGEEPRLHVFLRLLTLVMTISTVFQTFAMLKVERYIKTIGLSKHLSTIQFPISMASPFLNTSCLS